MIANNFDSGQQESRRTEEIFVLTTKTMYVHERKRGNNKYVYTPNSTQLTPKNNKHKQEWTYNFWTI